MPGLAQEEDDEGRLHLITQFQRSVTVLHVHQQRRAFQRALLRLMAEVQGTSMQHAAMPDQVYRAHFMSCPGMTRQARRRTATPSMHPRTSTGDPGSMP